MFKQFCNFILKISRFCSQVRIVAGGAGNGASLSQLSYPSGIAVVTADVASELELLQRFARALRLFELAAKTEVDEVRDAVHVAQRREAREHRREYHEGV